MYNSLHEATRKYGKGDGEKPTGNHTQKRGLTMEKAHWRRWVIVYCASVVRLRPTSNYLREMCQLSLNNIYVV